VAPNVSDAATATDTENLISLLLATLHLGREHLGRRDQYGVGQGELAGAADAVAGVGPVGR